MHGKNVFLKNGMLEFSGMPPVEPSLRLLKDMKGLFQDPSMDDDGEVLYLMYANVEMPEHKALFRKMRLKHDITVMPPKFIGREFNKTLGHYHPDGHRKYSKSLKGNAISFSKSMT